MHRDIRPSNVTYKKDKDKVSFYLIDFGWTYNDDKNMDEANVNLHRTILQDLRHYFPIEQYFFHIITYFSFDSILFPNIQPNTTLRELFNAEGINAKCIINSHRTHIKNLLNCIHVYFKHLYSNSDMADIWVKCYDIIHKVITDQMKTTIKNETQKDMSPVYDEIYTKFSKIFYDGINNTQKINKDNVGIRVDQHGLGALILVLLECKTDVDEKRSKISKELARDVMFGRKKLADIHRKSKKLASTSPSKTIDATNNKNLNMKSLNEYKMYMSQPLIQMNYPIPMGPQQMGILIGPQNNQAQMPRAMPQQPIHPVMNQQPIFQGVIHQAINRNHQQLMYVRPLN